MDKFEEPTLIERAKICHIIAVMEAMTKLVGLRQLELVDWLAYVWLKTLYYIPLILHLT